jgi:hypothetical protein
VWARGCLTCKNGGSWPGQCATEALLVAAGGALTTLLGTPVEHAAAAPTPNRLGVVATARSFAARGGRTHRELCAALNHELNPLLAALVGGGLE